MKTAAACLILCFSISSFAFAADEHDHHHHDAIENLGSVSFPTSCAAAVQGNFERGVALLHSFEYEMADQEFETVTKGDPHCAMAYWGRAMTLYHELWGPPSPDDLKRGAEFMAKARELKAPTSREGDYIKALSAFYTDVSSTDNSKRAKAYAKEMAGVHERNPDDTEAAVFYALSLLASGDESDANLTSAKAAVTILNKLFDEQPTHPGIAHYIIHACDNPSMASMALPAARKYASIAPISAHAVHMPSHIFARLGLWQDDINSNLAALRAADQMAGMHLHVAHHRVHSMDFLEYAYLQVGDDAAAKAQVDAVAGVAKSEPHSEFADFLIGSQMDFASKYAIERRQWIEALQLEPIKGVPPQTQLGTYWAHAIAAGHLHDGAAGRKALKQYERLLATIRKGPKAYIAEGLKNEHDVVKAWAQYGSGKTDRALALLRGVADTQDKTGKGETELPAREMLADMLLDAHRPKDALAEYEVSLHTDPNRFNGLFGAAQAARQAQQNDKAQGYYAQLLKNCDGVQSDRPELSQARTLMASR